MNTEQKTQTVTIEIGAPAISSYYGAPERTGYVAKMEPQGGNVYTLGAGRMERQAWQVTVAWDDATFSTVSEGIAQPWLDRAARSKLAPIGEDAALEMLRQAERAQAERNRKAAEERDAYQNKVNAWRDQHRDKIPADAVAVIVAKLEHDDSDAMTDYFNTKTSRVILLAFSTHRRDLFSEMRKAARNFSETAHLADAPADAEHREKWSMGAGYYLKASNRYSDGWKVRKESLYLPHGVNDRAAALPFGEWAVPEAEAEPKAERIAKPDAGGKVEGSAETVAGMIISEHVHTKKGFAFYIVQAPERVARDTFDSWLNRAKGLRGWYSRKWGDTPAGFAFKDRAAAVTFAEGCANA